jgi:hypothetical protein
MKTDLIVHTPNAGPVRILADHSQENGCATLVYPRDTLPPALRTAAARYLFEEGFIELANGVLDIECAEMG